jgi:hypothetical protein
VTNERGAINLPIVFAVVFGLGLVASAYLNYSQHKNATQDHKLLQGEITDLRYQVNQDHLAATTSPTPSASPLATPQVSPTVSPIPSPAVTPAAAPKATTVKISGNVHAGPNTSSKVLLPYTQLPVGTPVTLGALSGPYQQIIVKNVTGYILASDLN